MKNLLIALFIFLSIPAHARDLTVILSSDSDGHTTVARIFGKYIAKHMNQETKIIFKVVPGAAGLNSTNYLYNIAPKDGSTIGIMFKNIPIIGVLNRTDSNINFDASKFTWLGSIADGRKDVVLLVSNKPLSDVELIVGSETVTAANPVDFISKYTNIKIKKVTGYVGANNIRLAFLRNEVDAIVANLLSILTYDREWIDTHHIILQLGNGRIRHPMFKNVPTLQEIVTDNKNASEALSILENQFALVRSYIAPPDIPKDRAIELRKAFRLATQDIQFLEEAKRINHDILPIYHEEAQKIVNETYSAPKELIDLLK
jgi:tripartite-type tricarboxylate transporter receptor subunit TctC